MRAPLARRGKLQRSESWPMAGKHVDRDELQSVAAAAEPRRTRPSRRKPAGDRPIDPTFRVLRLNDALINTYFSWCPASRMPAVAPHGTDAFACGQLHLQMQQLAGLRHLWDLVGKSGWMVMEAVWLNTEPREQYLLVGAHVARGSAPGQAVVPVHLWQLWQPSYSPRFVWRPHGMSPPSAEMRTALERTLEQHLTESARAWVERAHEAARASLEGHIDTLNQRVSDLDDQRRRDRRSPRARDSGTAGVRKELFDAEQQVADLSESLARLQAPAPPAIRQRLCEVQWFVQAPEYRRDPIYERLEGPKG
jgi:hypothetical protein